MAYSYYWDSSLFRLFRENHNEYSNSFILPAELYFYLDFYHVDHQLAVFDVSRSVFDKKKYPYARFRFPLSVGIFSFYILFYIEVTLYSGMGRLRSFFELLCPNPRRASYSSYFIHVGNYYNYIPFIGGVSLPDPRARFYFEQATDLSLILDGFDLPLPFVSLYKRLFAEYKELGNKYYPINPRPSRDEYPLQRGGSERSVLLFENQLKKDSL